MEPMCFKKLITKILLPGSAVFRTYDLNELVLGVDLLEDGFNHEASLMDSGWMVGYEVVKHTPTGPEVLMEGKFVVDLGSALGDMYMNKALLLQLFGLITDDPTHSGELTLPTECATVRDAMKTDVAFMDWLHESDSYPLQFLNQDGDVIVTVE